MIARLVGRVPAPFRHRWGVAALVLAGGALRAAQLDGMSIWQDEGLSLYRATRDLEGVLAGLIPLGDLITRDVHPPLYFLTLAGWLRLAGVSTWTAKWLSWVFLLPVPAVIWTLGRRTVGNRPALLASALAALSPLYLWYAQEIRSYGVMVTLGAVSVYGIWRAAVPDPPPGLDGRDRLAARWPWALLGVASAGALLWTHYLGFMLLPVLAVLAVVGATKARSRRAVAPLALVALLAVPLLPFALDRLGLGAERDQHFVPFHTMALDVFRGFGFGRTLYPAEALTGPAGPAVWVLIALLALLVAMGAVAAWRTRPAAGVALVAYLALPVVGTYLVTLVKPIYLGAYHLIVASPAFYLLLAAGIAAVGRRSRSLGLASAGVVACVMLLADARYLADDRFRKDDLRAMVDYVERRAVPGDVLALSDPVLERSVEHLARRVPIVTVPRMLYTSTLDDRPPEEQLAPLLAEHARVWFMTPLDAHKAWLEEHAVRVDAEAFHGASIPVHVTAYEPPGAADAGTPLFTATADLGGLRLSGATVAPSPLRPGAVARIRLRWTATSDRLPDYKVAVRLLGADGRERGDGDHAPFHGERPVSRWPIGQVVVEPHDLFVDPGTPPGVYTVAVTVYDPATGEQHPTDHPHVLGAVQVGRPDAPPPTAALPMGRRVSAVGGMVDVLGVDVPAGPHPPGAEVDLAVWLRSRGAGALPGTLRAEVLDAWGRVETRADARLDADAQDDDVLAGDVRKVFVTLRLPAAAGRHQLRLRLLDPAGRPSWFRRGPIPVRGIWAAHLTVVDLERQTSVPAEARPIGVPVGAVVRLEAAALPRAMPEAGSVLPVDLYWSTFGPVETAYHVTVQVVLLAPDGTPAGAPVAQVDGPPASGARPSTGWLPGEVVEDRHELQLPADLPPGTYRLLAALYDPAEPSAPRPTVVQDGETRDYVRLLDFGIPSGANGEGT